MYPKSVTVQLANEYVKKILKNSKKNPTKNTRRTLSVLSIDPIPQDLE